MVKTTLIVKDYRHFMPKGRGEGRLLPVKKHKKPLLLLGMLFYPLLSLIPEEKEVHLSINIAKAKDYQRPQELLERDREAGITFPFHPGLEIFTNLDAVKIYIFDTEAGRSPYENSAISPGRLRIRMEKPGYEAVTFWAEVLEDARTSIYVEYPQKDSAPLPREQELSRGPWRAGYRAINPEDAPFYRCIARYEEENGPPVDGIIRGKGGEVVSLSSLKLQDGQIFIWDGKDASGRDVPEGEYRFNSGGDGEGAFSCPLKVDRGFSRRRGSYFSGISGLVLVPGASVLFPGSYELASGLILERVKSSGAASMNLPFSFLFRISPLKRWEAAFQTELAFITEKSIPSLKLNTSQKFMLVKGQAFLLTAAVRGSWLCGVNDFKEKQGRSLLRDPGGFSLHLPMEYRFRSWVFLLDPDFLFALQPVGDGAVGGGGFDMAGGLRWGLSREGRVFSAGLSSALFFPSLRNSDFLMQLALEGSYCPPYTALYITAFIMAQSSRTGNNAWAYGLNVGFLF